MRRSGVGAGHVVSSAAARAVRWALLRCRISLQVCSGVGLPTSRYPEHSCPENLMSEHD